VLADRPQGVTMQRLARMAAPQQSARGCMTRFHWCTSTGVWGCVGAVGKAGAFVAGPDALDDGTSAAASRKPPDEVMERVQERWESFLEDVGCSHPEAVTKAFKNIVEAGAGLLARLSCTTINVTGRRRLQKGLLTMENKT